MQNIIPLLLSLKVASYIFYNYYIVSSSLSVLSFFSIIIILFKIKLFRVKINWTRNLIIYLTLSILATVHAIINSENFIGITKFFIPIIISFPYFILIDYINLEGIKKFFYFCGLWLILKIFTNFFPISIIWIDSIYKIESVNTFISNVYQDLLTPMGVLGDKMRFADSGLILFPLIFLVIRGNSLSVRVITLTISFFVLFASFTFSFFISLFSSIIHYLMLRKYYYFILIFAVLSLIGVILLINSNLYDILLLDKRVSINIKVALITNTFQILLENPLGVGVGYIDERVIRSENSGDIFFENSYLYLIYAYGIFSVIPIIVLLKIFINNVKMASYSYESFVIASTVLWIFQSSLFNPYFFAGGVYVIIYASLCYHQKLCFENNLLF